MLWKTRHDRVATGNLPLLERTGHALRANLSPVGKEITSSNPFVARRFGPPGNDWARQIRQSRNRSFEVGPHYVFKGRNAPSTPVDPEGEDRSGSTKRDASGSDHSRMRVDLRCMSFTPRPWGPGGVEILTYPRWVRLVDSHRGPTGVATGTYPTIRGWLPLYESAPRRGAIVFLRQSTRGL
jgi:hypothetical protein